MAAQRSVSDDFSIGDWLVRPSLGRIERGTHVVRVTPQSMRVLVCLADADGRVVSRSEIMDSAWPRLEVTPDALSQCIVELRKAFGDDSRRAAVIETIPKVGLRLIPPVSRTAPSVPDSRPTGPAPTAPNPSPARIARLAAWAAAGTIVLGAVAVLGGGWLTRDRWSHTAPEPLAGADFRRITDFIGAEEQAAISRDGQLVAFLSDRAGEWDVWVGEIGSASFRNVTRGAVPGLRNADVRALGFSPDGANVEFWTKTADAAGGMIDYYWTAPVGGGPPRRSTGPISEVGWSRDGERFVYHPSAPGDPLFITSPGDSSGGQRIYGAPPGVHNHFPLLSFDGQTVYFVQGRPPDEMDIWQVAASGGDPERLTFHRSRVGFPTLLDERTLLYLATDADGSGPWLRALDLQRRASRRIDTGSSTYTSIDASADGRRLVVTEPHRTATLRRVALAGGTQGAATQIEVPTRRVASPRLGPGLLVYRAPKAGADALWAVTGAEPSELWSSVDGRVVGGPVLTRDGTRLAFVAQEKERTRLLVMNSDGSHPHTLAAELDVRGSPAWSPDGRWIAVSALRDGAPRLYKIPVTAGAAAVSLGDAYALDPAWSPSGDFIVFSGVDVAGKLSIGAVNVDGTPHALPPLSLGRGSRRLVFLGENPDALVILTGSEPNKEFRVVHLVTGEEHPLADVGSGLPIGDFDVSADGTEIVFDLIREESDIVAIDLRAAR